jgi:hypothetical protein
LRITAIWEVPKLDGASSLPVLTQLAKSARDNDTVRFWAGVGVVTITDGAIEDVDILTPINAYSHRSESEGAIRYRMGHREAALKKVVAHGKNEAARSKAAKMLAKGTDEDSERRDYTWIIVAGAFILALFVEGLLCAMKYKGKGKDGRNEGVTACCNTKDALASGTGIRELAGG